MTDLSDPWTRAQRALTALAVDPAGLKGMCLRARVGPVRRLFEQGLSVLPAPHRRIHTGVSDTQLYGGLDVSASLTEQKLVRQAGLVDAPCTIILPMAERCTPALAIRLGQMLDTDLGHSIVLLDEGVEPDETVPQALKERLAFDLDLDGLRYDQALTLPETEQLDRARDHLAIVRMPSEHTAQLTAIAARFGVDSLRAPLLARRAACAFAALAGRDETCDADLREAAELVFTSRATQIPEPDPAPEEPETPQEPNPQDSAENVDDSDISQAVLEDMIIAAIAAQLPSDILERAAAKAPRSAILRGSGAGARRKGNRRGRPMPSRPGRLDGTARIDIIATLRSAAPFQTLRKRAGTDGPRIILYPSDIRLRRFEDKSDRLLIFAVDASGSAAMARMAEAKGAVELMLAQAYSKRDQVALVAFRGSGADVLLPPTRSLVQAKRRLAALPGGGGTPLATGLLSAAEMAELGRGHGLSPSLIVLTDGRANVGLDAQPGREQAKTDAQRAATQVRQLGMPAVVIDTAARPGRDGETLAGWLDAHYLALPRADAERISTAADAALST